jgi:NAD-dependent DNA ligase
MNPVIAEVLYQRYLLNDPEISDHAYDILERQLAP